MNVMITGLRLVDAEPNRGGNRPVAHFDCLVAGIQLNGCALLRTPAGGHAVRPPLMVPPKKGTRAVIFKGDLMRNAILKAALKVYDGMRIAEAGYTEPQKKLVTLW